MHTLLHLYESGASELEQSRFAAGRRNGAFARALTNRMPTLVHLSAWVGERLHKRVKSAARKVAACKRVKAWHHIR